MSENRKYYYMKVKEDFYESEEIILLESMPDGHLYSNILMKMYLKSLRNEGKLMIRDRIPYSPTVLAQVVRQPVAVVEKALHLFTELGLVDILDNGAIFMMDIQDYIGHGSSEGERKRKYRAKIEEAKQKCLLIGEEEWDNVPALSQRCPKKRPPEIEIEIYKEKEQEEKEKTGQMGQSDGADANSPISLWDKIVGLTLTGYLAEKLNDLYEEVGAYAYEKALKTACERNKRNFKYIEATARGIASGNDFDEQREKEKAKAEKGPVLSEEQKQALAFLRDNYARVVL